jgi:hypothetical protein
MNISVFKIHFVSLIFVVNYTSGIKVKSHSMKISLWLRVARWYICILQSQMGIFRPWKGNCWHILRPFGKLCAHLVYFVVNWYTNFYNFLVCCTEKNLAILRRLNSQLQRHRCSKLQFFTLEENVCFFLQNALRYSWRCKFLRNAGVVTHGWTQEPILHTIVSYNARTVKNYNSMRSLHMYIVHFENKKNLPPKTF